VVIQGMKIVLEEIFLEPFLICHFVGTHLPNNLSSILI
jgi:hypothetical protein